MIDFTVRPCERADIPALAALWQRTFGDCAELTDEFYRLLPSMGTGFAAVCAGEVIGEAHLLTDLELISSGERGALAYLYAVAVDDRFRGNGVGAALVSSAEAFARENSLIFCTEPAEESLFAWYESVSCLKYRAYCGQKTVPAAPGEITGISAREYLARRDALSPDSTVRPGSAAAEFAQSVCRIYGGGLFASPGGIVAAYPDGGVLKVCELIGDEAAASAAAYRLSLPAAQLRVLSPDGSAYLASDAAIAPDVLWQMTFD